MKKLIFPSFCWPRSQQSASSVLPLHQSVDQIHFMIDFIFRPWHSNPSLTRVIFLSVMIFWGCLGFFFPLPVFSHKVDVLSKTDPAKTTCQCHNFRTVCELDMDLYFRQPWGETSLWRRWQRARLQRVCASLAACSLSIRMPAPRMGFFFWVSETVKTKKCV